MRYVIAVVILVAAGILIFGYRGSVQPDQGQVVGGETGTSSGPAEPQRESAPATTPEPAPETEADRSFAQKRAMYEKLEKARRDLNRRLARMKMSLWNVRLPREQADTVTEQLMSAYKLINKPKLMGAFHNQAEMEQELTQVEYAKEKVEELRLQVEAWKESGEG